MVHAGHPRRTATRPDPADPRTRALERAAGLLAAAPPGHTPQPWRSDVHHDRMDLRVDPSRRLEVRDPRGRALVQAVGAALLSARVALAAEDWAVEVDRFPRPEDPHLLAVVRPVAGRADPALAALAPAVARLRSGRGCASPPVPAEVHDLLAAAARAEGTCLVSVSSGPHRHLVARLTQQADDRRTAGADEALVLLATPDDGPEAWLRSGEALQRVLLELARRGYAASPLPQAVAVPLTRTQLRAALTWDAHPQLLLRIDQPEQAALRAGDGARQPLSGSPGGTTRV